MKKSPQEQACTYSLSLTALLLGGALSACSHSSTDQLSPPQTTLPVAEETHTATPALADQASEMPAQHRLQKVRQLSGVMPLQTMIAPIAAHGPTPIHNERYAKLDSNSITRTEDKPVSTFSLDVDSGSYAVVRRYIQHGQLPPAAAVRLEELVNYFNYSIPAARDSETPFAFQSELATSPWSDKRQLLRVSVAAWQQPLDQLPPSNLVFLVDVSGSMQSPDKLPLLKASLKLLARQLRAQDSVSLVTYAGHSAVVLEPTSGSDKRRIIEAIDSLGAGGGTHGAAGLKEAYRLAAKHKIDDGINRVLLATDGDFNVGLFDTEALVQTISDKRREGISLTTLGFGQGNYNDHLMEQLADKGDGNHAYIDTLMEAKKVLLEQVGATLYTVAKDAKIQVEFNPAQVSEYRLLGYENRQLREQDFNNDKVDAGDIGAGHTVTALYEVALRGSGGERLPAHRYAANASREKPLATPHSDELAWVKLRYKPRERLDSILLQHTIKLDDQSKASTDLRFSAAVAAWAEWLRQDENAQIMDVEDILALAESGKGQDQQGYRAEFIQLVKLSEALR